MILLRLAARDSPLAEANPRPGEIQADTTKERANEFVSIPTQNAEGRAKERDEGLVVVDVRRARQAKRMAPSPFLREMCLYSGVHPR
jgi:hypothetical protein